MYKLKHQSYRFGTLILLVTTLLTKIIGLVYRIPLTNILGAKGVGYYQLIMPIYVLAFSLTSAYLPVSVSKCVAYLGNAESKTKILNSAILFAIISCIIIGILILINASFISKGQKAPEITKIYYLLIPILIVVGLKSAFKGWFVGERMMLYPSISQFFEQIIKVVCSILLMKHFIKRGIEYAVAGAFLGLLFGEISGFLLLVIFYFSFYKTSLFKFGIDRISFRTIASESKPLIVSGLVFPVVSFIDSFIIVNFLCLYGDSAADAVSKYGILQGPVSSLVNLPIMLGVTLSLGIIPLISSMMARYDIQSIKEKTSFSLKISLIVAIPALLGMAILSKPIINCLYPNLVGEELVLATRLLCIAALNIALLSTLEIINSILQSLGQAKAVAINLSIVAAIKILLETVLIKYLNIYAVAISNVMFYLIATNLNVRLYVRLIGENFGLFKSVSKIMVASVIMALLVILSIFNIKTLVLKLIVGIVVGIVVYMTEIYIFKILDDKELKLLPFSKLFLKTKGR